LIYFLKRKDGSIKIGHTGNIRRRMMELGSKHGKLELLGMTIGNRSEEQELHKHFAHCRVKDEWFSPSDELMLFIKKNTSMTIPLPLETKPKKPSSTASKVFASKFMFRSNLKAMRQKLGISRMDIVREARIAYTTVFSWEEKLFQILDPETTYKLTQLLGCSMSELVEFVSVPQNPKN
jgi:DNA-binding transcriptional regulator YiaG